MSVELLVAGVVVVSSVAGDYGTSGELTSRPGWELDISICASSPPPRYLPLPKSAPACKTFGFLPDFFWDFFLKFLDFLEISICPRISLHQAVKPFKWKLFEDVFVSATCLIWWLLDAVLLLEEAITISLTKIYVTTNKGTQRETLIILFLLEELLIEVPSCLFWQNSFTPGLNAIVLFSLDMVKANQLLLERGERNLVQKNCHKNEHWAEPSMKIIWNTSSQMYSSPYTWLCPTLQQLVKLLKWKLFEDSYCTASI